MNVLYHMVPKDLRGTTLYPLNVLKDIHPDIYKLEMRKYAGREYLLDLQVPVLGCLWNDVLHLTAVDPKKIQFELNQLGQVRHFDYVEIPADALDPANTVVYLYRYEDPKDKLALANFREYLPSEVGLYSELSEETVSYYQQSLSEGRRPLLFHLVPHILYKGSIDITGWEKKTI